MTKQKSTKRALLLSAVSLLLCASMFVGSTFAWFTDTVSSGRNTIQSGNLDIELYYASKADAAEDEWIRVDKDTDIFGYDLWEPGHTRIAYFKVVNEGSLALKYQLTADVVDEEKGTNKDGDELTLSNYIYTKVIEPDETRADILASTDGNLLKGSIAMSGERKLVAAGKATGDEVSEEIIGLAIWMPTSVGNEANHNGSDIPFIAFGINLVATQLASEEDSFDNQYDVKATYLNQDADGAWLINNMDELFFFENDVNNGNDYLGETVKLTADIDLSGYNWIPIGNWDNTFSGTFDGQGYTISNLYINAPAGEGVGLFGVTLNANIKGVNLKNVDVTGYSMVSALVGASYPSIISNCNVTGNINLVADWAYVGGIAGYCNYGTQVDNCSVVADGMGTIVSENRNAVGGITAWLLEGDHKVTNCKVKNLNLTGWTNIGGITGFVHYNNTIEGCSVENVNLTKTRVGGNPGIGLIAGGWSYSASNAITLRNNTVNNATLEGNHIAYDAYNELYGSEYGGATTANFVLDGNTTANIKNNLIEVKMISSSTELENALAAAQDGDTIVLGSDVEATLDAVQKADTKITIDGNGNVFKGSITVDGRSATITSAGITIKNVVFDSTASEYDACVRLGASGNTNTRYTCNVTVENCTFIGDGSDTKVAIKSYTGGDKNLTVKNCVATDMHSLLQIANAENLTVEGCTVTGKRGMSVGASTGVQVTDTTIDATTYGIRSEGRADGGGITITDCDITANIPVVIRKVAKAYSVTFNGTNTMTETNSDGLWCVAATNEYGDVDKAGLTSVGAAVTITVNDAGLDQSGIFVKE